jgi:hypothetical protein
MGEFGGKSFMQSVKDWNELPIEGALFQHAKDMYQEGQKLTGWNIGDH